MAFNFKVYEGVTLESLGTLAEVTGAGGSLRFTNRTLGDSSKSLCVIITRKDGTSDTVTCSKAVTAGVRNALASGKSKKECLSAIINLDIVEAPNGGNYISAPRSEGGVEVFTITELKRERVNYEELVAL